MIKKFKAAVISIKFLLKLLPIKKWNYNQWFYMRDI
jgi:hypothetical protein